MTGRDLFFVGAITLVGVIIRAFSVLAADFPLNDGGLFYQMVLDLQETWPTLPAVTSYNRIDAPFAYPPLGFYVGAALHGWLGTEIMRFVPLVAASTTVPAFYLLARSLIGPGAVSIAATGAFAVMPRSFEWMTMGGGLTRAPGLLLAILTVWLTHRMLRRPGWGRALAAGIGGGLVLLTHPQAALFVLISSIVLVAFLVRERATAASAMLAAAVAVGVTGPWLLTVTSRHGIEPLISASGTQPGPFIGLLSLISFQLTGSRLFDVIGLLAAIGLVISLLRRDWFLPAWLAATLVLDARGGAMYAAIPGSLLAARALVEFVLFPKWRSSSEAALRRRSSFARQYPLEAALALTLATVAVVDAFGSQIAPTWPGVALTAEQRAAVQRAGTNPAATYLVVSGKPWHVDATAEWFPYLSGARSVGTVQGHEWLGREEFAQRLEASEALRVCANAGGGCLAGWSDRWGIEFSHVFIPKGSVEGPMGDPDCCSGLRELLGRDDRYRLVFDDVGATVYEKIDG